MYIDVFISGERLHRWKIDDFDKCNIEGATWEENVLAREKLAEMFFQHFLRFTAPLIATIGKAEFYLVFESKMHTLPDEEPKQNEPQKINTFYEQ